MQRTSLANYHIPIGMGRHHGDGSCFHSEKVSQITIFDYLSQIKGLCVPLLSQVSSVWITVTKWGGFINQWCVCNSHIGHPNVLDSKSS